MAVTFANNQYYARNTDQLVTGANSFCAWVRRTSFNTTYDLIVSGSDGSADALALNVDSSTAELELVNDGVQVASPTSPVLTTNEWRFVAYSQPAGADGTCWIMDPAGNVGSASGASRPVTNTVTVFCLGYASGYGFIGDMAGVRFWAAALTEAEILNEAWSIRPRRLQDVYIWSPFLAGPETTDRSGNARNWSVTGSPTAADGPPAFWGAPPLVVGWPMAETIALPGYYL